MDEVPELIAVAGASAGVGIEHDVIPGRHELLFDIESVSVVGEGSAVNLENQRVLSRGVEIRGLQEPALYFPAVLRRVVPDLLDIAELLSREQILVHRGQDLDFGVSHRAHRDVARHMGTAVGGRESSVFRDRDRPAASVGAEARPEVPRELLDWAVEGHEVETGVPLVVRGEVDPAPVGGPAYVADVAIEAVGQGPRAASIASHHVEPRTLISLVAVVETEERDPSP